MAAKSEIWTLLRKPVGAPRTASGNESVHFPKTSEAVAELLSGKKRRVPLHLEYRDPLEKEVAAFLNSRVLGQEESVAKISRILSMRLSQAGEREAPMAVLYLWGPTGVGKTETAYALAEFFLWNRERLTRIKGENYQEHHTSRDLFGAPKSYVGYAEPTPLNDVRLFAARKKAAESNALHPSVSELERFSILLLDEADKFHYRILQNFLGILDHGKFDFSTGIEDNEELTHSRTTDFRETIVILTSNAGEHERSLQSERAPIGFSHSKGDSEADGETIVRNSIRELFSPEFLDRIDLVARYSPLSIGIAEGIVQKSLGAFKLTVDKRHGRQISINVQTETVRSAALDPKKGARNFRRSVEENLVQPIRLILQSGQISGIPHGMGVTLRIEGEIGNLRPSLELSKNPETVHAEVPTVTVSGKILDTAAKIAALERLYGLAFQENVPLDAEIVRLEKDLRKNHVPQEEINAIRQKIAWEIEIRTGAEEFRTAMEADGQVEQEYHPEAFPELSKLFYPLSSEVILEVVQDFARNAEETLRNLQAENLWNGLVFDAIKQRCERMLGKELTKDQHDFVIQAFHHVYVASKGKMRPCGGS